MRRDTIRSGFHVSPGPLSARLAADVTQAAEAAERVWRRDASAWTSEAEVAKKIENRLGWLTSTTLMEQSFGRLKATADAAVRDGFTDVVLLGMGGSSLAPEVLRAVIGVGDAGLRLQMIDSTDPAAVRAVNTDPRRTLYLLASKSGTTIEPNSLAAHFQKVLESVGIDHWGDHFVAITDPGTALAARAQTEGFRDTFINPPDIGGRYSALSFFGLVPAALMGQDVESIVAWGRAMLEEAQSAADPLTNPAVGLGHIMAVAARAGRDKLTLVVPASLEPFGLWVEQLVAESTGKNGVGVVPIAGESLGAPQVYGNDRAFVRLRLASDPGEAARDGAMARLGAGAPIVTIDLPEPAALGAEFMRWEIATAIAGSLLGINPFDEPNVQQAKDATNVLLAKHKSDGKLPENATDGVLDGGTVLTLTSAARAALRPGAADALLSLIADGDYVGILAYLGPDPELYQAFRAFRQTARDTAAAATMFGYGPRYLHSTGQLHKGGANNGVFVLVTATPAVDVPIPGQPFSFGTLEQAQARGDFASLDGTGRRAVHVHLPSPDPQLLARALSALAGHLPHRAGGAG